MTSDAPAGLRVVVAEDLALLRDGLVALLSRRGHEVTGVSDGEALVAEVERRAAAGEATDVVVTDIRMPPSFTDEGLRAALALRAAHPQLPRVHGEEGAIEIEERERHRQRLNGRGGSGFG